MSTEESNIPPAGEDIHLPGGSIQPLLLTIGTTIALIGLTWKIEALVFGLVMVVAVLAWWIKEAVEEYRHLPLEHGEHH